MMQSLLIANRGEIARRILRTARRLGVRTIAVYSDADAQAPFVHEADEAVAIGPAPARESYLAVAKILAAAHASGAEAIHPGYGFLSENAAFADAVTAAGLIWVGAPAAAIRAMGLKDAAKALMIAAGVPVTPGYLGAEQGLTRLAEEAAAVGYPVLIKAVAGGGGKGMRRVDEPQAFAEALASCRREAAAAFGDDRVLIEKYVLAPRHIEVQVFGDTHGQIVHLFERDCSLQRRHQKVIEEAPAPGMDGATREFICGVAVRAAAAVKYVGAGTIEFIADASQGLRPDRIWFMEMNTRLQVEHPVTEAITGQDLVEWQLRVAAGERLPRRQEELCIDGWAMEARLYAENPTTGFLPSTGPLRHLRLPTDVRVDSGVEAGGEITGFYDPLMAKLIVHAPQRRAAAARLAAACGAVEVWPVRSNAAFLARVAADPAFVAGEIDTGFIERRAATLIPAPEPDAHIVFAAARALLPAAGSSPWTGLAGFRAAAAPQCQVAVAFGDKTYFAMVDRGGVQTWTTREGTAEAVTAEAVIVEAATPEAGTPEAGTPEAGTPEAGIPRRRPVRTGSGRSDNGTSQNGPPGTMTSAAGESAAVEAGAGMPRGNVARVASIDGERVLFSRGEAWSFGLPSSARPAGSAVASDGALRSPMPGRIVNVTVRQGDQVSKGQPLLALEAMKMEHALLAPFDGVVAELSAAEGDQVAENVTLVRIAAS